MSECMYGMSEGPRPASSGALGRPPTAWSSSEIKRQYILVLANGKLTVQHLEQGGQDALQQGDDNNRMSCQYLTPATAACSVQSLLLYM